MTTKKKNKAPKTPTNHQIAKAAAKWLEFDGACDHPSVLVDAKNELVGFAYGCECCGGLTEGGVLAYRLHQGKPRFELLDDREERALAFWLSEYTSPDSPFYDPSFHAEFLAINATGSTDIHAN